MKCRNNEETKRVIYFHKVIAWWTSKKLEQTHLKEMEWKVKRSEWQTSGPYMNFISFWWESGIFFKIILFSYNSVEQYQNHTIHTWKRLPNIFGQSKPCSYHQNLWGTPLHIWKILKLEIVCIAFQYIQYHRFLSIFRLTSSHVRIIHWFVHILITYFLSIYLLIKMSDWYIKCYERNKSRLFKAIQW